MTEKKYVAIVGFACNVEGDDSADAVTNLGIALRNVSYTSEVRNIEVRIMDEVKDSRKQTEQEEPPQGQPDSVEAEAEQTKDTSVLEHTKRETYF